VHIIGDEIMTMMNQPPTRASRNRFPEGDENDNRRESSLAYTVSTSASGDYDDDDYEDDTFEEDDEDNDVAARSREIVNDRVSGSNYNRRSASPYYDEDDDLYSRAPGDKLRRSLTGDTEIEEELDNFEDDPKKKLDRSLSIEGEDELILIPSTKPESKEVAQGTRIEPQPTRPLSVPSSSSSSSRHFAPTRATSQPGTSSRKQSVVISPHISDDPPMIQRASYVSPPVSRSSKSSQNRRSRSDNWIRDRKWVLGDKIGHGSFGEVFQGMNKETGQLFACKALPVVGKQAEVDKLAEEIDLMRGLLNPHIVAYLGTLVDEVKSMVYIFQEWVPGGSVAHLLKKFGPFHEDVVRNYTRQILFGLQYLHDHNIVHRDVKGGNILVDDTGTVKLADFGASRKFDLDGTQATTTIRG
jgi:hypothetical protein